MGSDAKILLKDSVRFLMLALRLLPPQLILAVRTLSRQRHPRWLHDAKRGWAKWEGHATPRHQEANREGDKHPELDDHGLKRRDVKYQEPQHRELKHLEPNNPKPIHQELNHQKPKRQELSLFEELFPEESDKQFHKVYSAKEQIPRLPLSDLDEVDKPDGHISGLGRPSDLTKAASRAAFRQWNLSILIIQRASKSLNESDFRRIAPKGQHIEDWKGPGDPLKVIPGRDPSTLQPAGHYFLLFPNPAYARAYQNHVIHTHRLATTHTPTSLESPMAPPKGMIIEGDNVHALLQDYALCPPSQKISLKMLFPPYSAGVKRLINQRGYTQLVSHNEKAGRAVLFWVNGHQPSTNLVRNVIAQDGRDRGMEWIPVNRRNSIEKVDVPIVIGDAEDLDDSESKEIEDVEEPGGTRRHYPRWIIPFVDEDEARRFVRAWHQRPFPVPRDPSLHDEPPPLVHVEFVW